MTSKLLNILHLDPRQLLLSARAVKIVHELFVQLDVQGQEALDDLAVRLWRIHGRMVERRTDGKGELVCCVHGGDNNHDRGGGL